MADTGSPLHTYSSLPPTYFEVGNEPNHDQTKYDGTAKGFRAYAERFYYAATGLYQAFKTQKAPSYYRILTGGVTSPDGESGCANGTIKQIYKAIINMVTGAGGLHGAVPAGNLGVGVHPYNFSTSSFKYNYYPAYPAGKPKNLCSNLGKMNQVWLTQFKGGRLGAGLPLLYTEINYSPPGSPNPQPAGGYLVDLFSYLYVTRSQQSANGVSTPYIVPSFDRLRVWWQQMLDTPNSTNGLYTSGGGTSAKTFTVRYCPDPRSKSVHTGGSYPEAKVFFYLRNSTCHSA